MECALDRVPWEIQILAVGLARALRSGPSTAVIAPRCCDFGAQGSSGSFTDVAVRRAKANRIRHLWKSDVFDGFFAAFPKCAARGGRLGCDYKASSSEPRGRRIRSSRTRTIRR